MVEIQNVVTRDVATPDDLMDLFNTGNKMRHVGATKVRFYAHKCKCSLYGKSLTTDGLLLSIADERRKLAQSFHLFGRRRVVQQDHEEDERRCAQPVCYGLLSTPPLPLAPRRIVQHTPTFFLARRTFARGAHIDSHTMPLATLP
jgi:hypothetical protein